MNRDVLVDSSFLIALFDTNSKQYAQAQFLFRRVDRKLWVPQVALTEVAYMLEQRLGNKIVESFLFIVSSGRINLVSVVPSDIQRVHEIRIKYTSSRFDFVDCCIMALAERLDIQTIYTLDKRDFTIYDPPHCEVFEILP